MFLAVVAVEGSLDAELVGVDVSVGIVAVALRYAALLQQLYHRAAPVVKIGFAVALVVGIEALHAVDIGGVAVVTAAQGEDLGVLPVHVVDVIDQVIGRDEVGGAVAGVGHLGGFADVFGAGARRKTVLWRPGVKNSREAIFLAMWAIPGPRA